MSSWVVVEVKRYIVRLTDEERKELTEMVSKGKTAAYKIKHANILLKADENGPAWTDQKIAEAFSTHADTVASIRQRFVEQGLEAALGRKKQTHPSRTPKFDGDAEAKLIAMSCSKAPDGRARWTLRLLANKVVELRIVESVSPETIRSVLKKTN
jgi:transposase